MDVRVGLGRRGLAPLLLLLASAAFRLERPPDFAAVFVRSYPSQDQQQQQEDGGPRGRTSSGVRTRRVVIPQNARAVDHHDLQKKKKQGEQFQLFDTQSSNRPVESVLDSMTLVNSFSCFQLNIFLFRFSMKEYKTGSSSLQDKTIFFFLKKRAKSLKQKSMRSVNLPSKHPLCGSGSELWLTQLLKPLNLSQMKWWSSLF